MSIRYSQRGFTLIELLVVIAIIGLLSSVVLSSLNTARSKARDAKRVADLRQIQIALELYYHDNGEYPNKCRASATLNASYKPWSDVLPTSYIPSMPVDPINTSNGTDDYSYYYCHAYRPKSGNPPWESSIVTPKTNYVLFTRLENSYASPNYHSTVFGLMSNAKLNYLIGADSK